MTKPVIATESVYEKNRQVLDEALAAHIWVQTI